MTQIKRRDGYNTKKILQGIVDTWRLEARQEPENLFYYINEVDQLRTGDKCYVIGRKGMGKTAISEYLFNINDSCVFSERLSFKNFPFNYLYSLQNCQYTSPNQYISIWKYLIYNTICKLLSRNNNVDNKALLELQKIYQPDPIKALSRLIPKWVATDFGIEVFGIGGSLSGIKREKEELTWVDKSDILEDIIEAYAGTENYYYILIDELDEDYRDFENVEEQKSYFYLITSLFKAVQDVKAYFRDTNIKIRPIVFLRSDIYALIKDSDKNKWREYEIDLSWNPNRLKQMIDHRLFISSEESVSENDIWNVIVPQRYVRMGNRGQHQMDPFRYITRSTQWRPRDYIHFMSECAKMALSKNDTVIMSSTIKQVDREFSEYLRGEITDEIYAVLPEIDTVFAIISQVRKQTVQPEEFLNAYIHHTGKSQEEGKVVLRQLFEHGVIGNQPSMRGQQIFKYQYPQQLFNFNENMVVHRGLYKALQIF